MYWVLIYPISTHSSIQNIYWASQVALVVKNIPANSGDIRNTNSIPGLGRFPWRRAWQLTTVFLPGESHGQRSWQATVHRVAKSWTQLKWLSAHTFFIISYVTDIVEILFFPLILFSTHHSWYVIKPYSHVDGDERYVNINS